MTDSVSMVTTQAMDASWATAGFDGFPSAAAMIDATGRVVATNLTWELFTSLNGGDPDRCGVGANYLEVCDRGADFGSEDAGEVAAGIRAVLAGTAERFEQESSCHAPFEHRWFLALVSRAVLSDGRIGAVVTHLDVTRRHLAEQRLAYESEHDPLTGLANRRAVERSLQRRLDAAHWSEERPGVVWIDVEDLPQITRNYGRLVGDRVVTTVAARLGAVADPTELPGRVGGRSFVVVTSATDDEALDSRARQVRHGLGHPIQVDRLELNVRFTIGSAAGTGPPRALIARARPGPPPATEAAVADLADVGRGVGAMAIRPSTVATPDPALFRALVDSSADLFTAIDSSGIVIFASEGWSRVLGHRPDAVVGRPGTEFIHPDDLERVYAEWRSAKGERVTSTSRLLHADGTWRYIESNGVDLTHEPSVAAWVTSGRDVTDRERAEAARRDSQRRYEVLAHHSTDPVVVHRDGRFVYVNPAMVALSGAVDENDLLGREVLDFVHPDCRDEVAVMIRDETDEGPVVRDMRLIRIDGSVVEAQTIAVPVQHGGLPGRMVVVRDRTDEVAARAELSYAAGHDSLTGLPNRSVVREHLEGAIDNARRTHRSVGVLFVDVDGFKLINDGYGHDIGDACLRVVADRLRALLSDEVTVGRFGGDEFLIVATVDGVADLEHLAEQVITEVGRPLEIDGHRIMVSASIGIALAAAGHGRSDVMVREADMAMYQAKARGRAGFEVFHEHLRAETVSRLRREQELHAAVAEGQFVVRYQPIISLHSGTVVAAEALLRWEHPVLGTLLPHAFLHAAEDTGLILPIGGWVFDEATKQSVAWQEELGGQPLRVLVNLSVRQLSSPKLTGRIAASLQRHRTDAHSPVMGVEMTEDALIQQSGPAHKALGELRSLGLAVWLDDFGAGYSSLAYLTRFPIDAIKIDKSFVSGVGLRARDEILLTGILDLSQRLGLTTVVEGVEHAAQADFLEYTRCDLVQGFHFARPMAPRDLAELVRGGPVVKPREK